MDEILLAVGLSRNTSPGPDGIHNQMLSHLSPSAKEFFLSLFNRIWDEHCFPSSWREGFVIPMLKPGKDRTLPSSYRPICLTSCVCKTMERMVNDRFVFILEKENLLAPAQCGFRRHRSAVDNLISLERQIQNCFVQLQQLETVFFDLDKTYDTTWHFGILRALHGWKF
jgi:hypothetical protein